jgi:hypothetical protein
MKTVRYRNHTIEVWQGMAAQWVVWIKSGRFTQDAHSTTCQTGTDAIIEAKEWLDRRLDGSIASRLILMPGA